MRPTSSYAAAVVTVLALACTAPPDTPAAPRPTTAALHTLPAAPSPPGPAGLEPARDGPDRTAARPSAGLARPAAERVAAGTIITRLEDEGLFTLDVDTSLEQPAPDRAQVTVRVLHGTGRGHPTEAIYTVELTRQGRTWTVTALQATS